TSNQQHQPMHLTHISKSFGETRAVQDASLEIRAGEVLALVGENGAGKTTLMRIAAGELTADDGEVRDRGRVGFVHQHFLLVPELTVAENLALIRPGFRFATRALFEREAAAVIAASGIELRDLTRRVADLSVGEKSKLELIKAIARNPSTLILDEPTSVLTPHEAEELFAVMRTLAARGAAIVFISHKLPEVLSVAQRVVVMRAGRIVLETREPTAEVLAKAMLDSPLAPREWRGRQRGGVAMTDGALLVHEGEIVAIVGVAGNGQAELAERLRDAFPAAAHIPEDRTRDGVIAQMSIAENLALKGVGHPEEMIELFSIRASGPGQRAGDLSGGNQQKVVLARELGARPRVIVAAEPTRGLDLEATRFVHERLTAAASGGAAILLFTSDLDEAFALADIIQVIYRGTLSERMTPSEASPRLAGLMAGVS
ncbi:MAG: ATP-binding cassette domain-containing protein, partial [Acidobacteriota bacterium]